MTRHPRQWLALPRPQIYCSSSIQMSKVRGGSADAKKWYLSLSQLRHSGDFCQISWHFLSAYCDTLTPKKRTARKIEAIPPPFIPWCAFSCARRICYFGSGYIRPLVSSRRSPWISSFWSDCNENCTIFELTVRSWHNFQVIHPHSFFLSL